MNISVWYLERVVSLLKFLGIPLSDTEMDYLRAKSNHLGVNYTNMI